jgi:hypothetical protein
LIEFDWYFCLYVFPIFFLITNLVWNSVHATSWCDSSLGASSVNQILAPASDGGTHCALFRGWNILLEGASMVRRMYLINLL